MIPSRSTMDASTSIGSIDRRDRLSYAEFVSEYLRPHRPVILTNAFPDWPALGKWTPEFFRERHGDRTVTVAGKTCLLREYIDRAQASSPENPCPYLRELTVREVSPELGDDLLPFVMYALPNWLRGVYPFADVHHALNRASEVELFIGGPGTRLERRKGEFDPRYAGLRGELISGYADLHYDPTACPVLLCQIFGRKHFTIFAPSDTPYLYTQGRHSMIDNFDEPDLARFPLLAKASPIRFVQEPGEAVYVPPFWWHTTRMMSFSIAVGSTFANGAHWDGVVEDVVREHGAESGVKRRALEAWLRTDGVLKARLGARLGEASHFRDPAWAAPLRTVTGAARTVKGWLRH